MARVAFIAALGVSFGGGAVKDVSAVLTKRTLAFISDVRGGQRQVHIGAWLSGGVRSGGREPWLSSRKGLGAPVVRAGSSSGGVAPAWCTVGCDEMVGRAVEWGGSERRSEWW